MSDFHRQLVPVDQLTHLPGLGYTDHAREAQAIDSAH